MVLSMMLKSSPNIFLGKFAVVLLINVSSLTSVSVIIFLSRRGWIHFGIE